MVRIILTILSCLYCMSYHRIEYLLQLFPSFPMIRIWESDRRVSGFGTKETPVLETEEGRRGEKEKRERNGGKEGE